MYLATDEGIKKELSNPKLDELLNILDETEEVIIWANYIHSIENNKNLKKIWPYVNSFCLRSCVRRGKTVSRG